MQRSGSVRSTVLFLFAILLATLGSPGAAAAAEREPDRAGARPSVSSRSETPRPDPRTPIASSVETPAPPGAKPSPARVRAATTRSADDGASGAGKVNINTASVKQLMTLTGVGRKVAESIVEYRDTHGPFKKADDLRKVEGVGTGLWEKNRDRIVTK